MLYTNKQIGEVDACRAILDIWTPKSPSTPNQQIINATDSSQTTALHKACANGHISTVQLLLTRNANHIQNDSGNTPLHWAAGAGHDVIVELLLDHYDALYAAQSKSTDDTAGNEDITKQQHEQLDVLLKNNFGRSALTEGFTSGSTKTVNHLLNHDSAEENKLIGGLDKEDVNDDNEANDIATSGTKKKEGIVHEFDFLRGDAESEIKSSSSRPSVLIRELPIKHADNPFGQKAIEDTTGLGIWCASLVMSRWLASSSMVQRMKNKTVCELGAGCGIPGLTAAVHGSPSSVIITDLNPETIDNIRHNIELNKTTTTTANSIDWGDESTYPSNKLDYVICSDCIYQKDIVPLLKKVVIGLLDPNHGTFLYVAPDGGRDGLPEFISAMKVEGFECVKEEIASDGYRCNPLKSGDEEDCFLHFHELASTVYVLYEFSRSGV